MTIQYDEAFKTKAMETLKEHNYNYHRAARALNISPASVRRWYKATQSDEKPKDTLGEPITSVAEEIYLIPDLELEIKVLRDRNKALKYQLYVYKQALKTALESSYEEEIRN